MTAAPSPTSQADAEPVILSDAPIDTWFGVGGRAERFAEVGSIEALASCVRTDPGLRVLGDGANLLVHDRGVAELVVSLTGAFRGVEIDPDGGVVAGAGVRLPQLINACVRAGLSGIEGLVGIPASVGGAAVMNAGGSFGSFGDRVRAVRVLRRDGTEERWTPERVRFDYRHTALCQQSISGGEPAPIVTAVELDLQPADPAACRERVRACMAQKSATQPLKDASAGCCFKNPTLGEAIDAIGERGQRVSAGLLIDRAGGKGLREGAAVVSDRHANFIVVEPDGTAGAVLALMDRVAELVRSRFGVTLEREVVVWGAP